MSAVTFFHRASGPDSGGFLKAMFGNGRHILLPLVATSLLTVLGMVLFNSLVVNRAFLHHIKQTAEEDALRIAKHLSYLADPEGDGFDYTIQVSDFRHSIDTLNLLKIKVYSSTGETVFSTNEGDLGMVNRRDYFQNIVTKGGTVSRLVEKNTQSLESEPITADVVETYVPVMKGGTFLGAFEIYYDVTTQKGRLDALMRKTEFALIILAAVFLSVLYGSTVITRKSIKEQQKSRNKLRLAMEKAENEKAKTDGIIAAIADGIAILDADFRILYQNDTHKSVVGDRAGEHCYRACAGNDRVCDGCPVARAFEDGRVHTLEKSRETDNGTQFFDIKASCLRDFKGEIVAGIEVVRDITDRKLSEQQMLEIQQLDEMILEASPVAFVLLDRQLRVVRVSPAYESITEYSPLEVLGKRPEEFMPDTPTRSGVLNRIRMVREMGERLEPREIDTPTRGQRHIVESMLPIKDAAGAVSHVLVVLEDITERKKMQDELKQHALYDSLTGLPNRALFMDRLKNLFAHKEREEAFLIAVLFLDLDRFKRINDSLGHMAGDELLISVGERLSRCVRPGDTVSRLGGDEFVIILDGIKQAEDSLTTADRIHQELRKPFDLKGQEVHITASIGIAVDDGSYDKADDFLTNADTAMYQAKARGRNRNAVYDKDMHDTALELITLENDLRRALENNEFVLHYQPIINIKTGRVSGFESLLRWNHPRRGLLPPESFIPIAEETGIIVPVGEWVVGEACRQAALWKARFSSEPDLFVSVNVSAKQFDKQLPGLIDSIVEGSGLGRKGLRLEITESVFIENSRLALEVLTEFREKGISVYLDDFGTGYSSLSYLHKFPVSALKIDRSFVKNILHDAHARQIMKAVATLAHSLEMQMVIEGVEEAPQLELFRGLDCELVQGNLFAEAMPGEAAERYMWKYEGRRVA